nr:nucleotide exchange factor GrpE [Actinomycetales bacterium]
MNPTGGEGNPEGGEQPIIRDKRRIDPETGRLREPQPGAESPETPESPGAPGAPDAAGTSGSAGSFAGSAGAGPFAGGSAGQPAGDAGGNLADLKAENAQLADELARANASYFNLNQEYANYVRRSKEQAASFVDEGREKVITALFGVLDDIQLARQHNELTGPLGSMAEKFENTLTTNFRLERYGATGEEFDPVIHEALMDTTSDEVEVPTIAAVIQPGYRMGEKVLRPARVAVNSPA